MDKLTAWKAGSLALKGTRLGIESTAIRKLREAGAIVLGTTNLTEWANFRSRDAPNGWSARGGQGLGPYCDMQDPAGSSSGSAVAARLGLATVCLGTEVRVPYLMQMLLDEIHMLTELEQRQHHEPLLEGSCCRPQAHSRASVDRRNVASEQISRQSWSYRPNSNRRGFCSLHNCRSVVLELQRRFPLKLARESTFRNREYQWTEFT